MGSGMKYNPTPLQGAFTIEFPPAQDDRGKFTRAYCRKELARIGCRENIAQANVSLTRKKGAIRGMHFQLPPMCESKIIRCIGGAVFDVIVDLRAGSPDFLQWHGEILSKKNNKSILVPKGFAHGFQVLEKDTQLLYFHTQFYSPSHESGIRFNDPALSIDWPLPLTDVSERDRSHPLLTKDYRGIQI